MSKKKTTKTLPFVPKERMKFNYIVCLEDRSEYSTLCTNLEEAKGEAEDLITNYGFTDKTVIIYKLEKQVIFHYEEPKDAKIIIHG